MVGHTCTVYARVRARCIKTGSADRTVLRLAGWQAHRGALLEDEQVARSVSTPRACPGWQLTAQQVRPAPAGKARI
eukprot:scaffold20989_cov108-Isochrysis_galbana.AAC.3